LPLLLRIAVFVLLVVLVYYGIKSIRENFRQHFKDIDEQKKARDQSDRARGNIVDLEKDQKTGVYKPKDKKD
jgi:predicted Holliday junction resolvase-like endonuclease